MPVSIPVLQDPGVSLWLRGRPVHARRNASIGKMLRQWSGSPLASKFCIFFINYLHISDIFRIFAASNDSSEIRSDIKTASLRLNIVLLCIRQISYQKSGNLVHE